MAKSSFPPSPLSQHIIEQTVSGFAQDVQPSSFMESACAVCGLLTTKKELKLVNELKFNKKYT